MSVASGKSLAGSSMAKPGVLTRLGMAANTPTGARHRSGSGNAITEHGHGLEHLAQPGCRVLSQRGHPLQPNRLVKPTPTRTGLVPSTRFAPCGAAYRGR
nr:hypothetical protein [uncultured bacterium]